MNLCEWDAKARLKAYGMPVPPSRLIEGAGEVDVTLNGAIAKAQMLSGKRGKAGLVRRLTANAASEIEEIVQHMQAASLPPVIMIEDAIEFESEFYLSVIIDDVLAAPVLLFSLEGGVDVEEGAAVHSFELPEVDTVRAHDLVDFFTRAGAPTKVVARLTRFAADLVRLFRAEEATLVEINPLAMTSSRHLLALDCKMILDSSALYRHADRDLALSQRLSDSALDPSEREAREKHFVLVKTPGDVILITAGAGLGMLCSDLLADAGFKSATFFDNASGAPGETVEDRLDLAFRLAEDDSVSAIMFYQALATRDLAPRVLALLKRLKAEKPPKPFYFGLSASFVAEKTMTAQAAREAIIAAGYTAFEFPDDVVAQMKADRDAGLLFAGAA